jgi:hypothetical protein
MSLTPLTDRDEIRRAFETTVSNLKDGATAVKRKVGWHGGGGEFDIYWRSKEQFWFFVDPDRELTRYWCCFGTSDPAKADNLTIVGEINPTKEGINRRNAGMFLVDPDGAMYLAHSGKVGGGRKGIGKSSFLAAYHGRNISEIQWPDGVTSSAIVIGDIQDSNLPAQIGDFIRTIQQYKEAFAR